jgi:uracil-DNA glycosylase
MSSLKRKGVPLADSAELKRPKKDGTLTSFFGAPKPAVPKTNGAAPNGSVPEPTPVKFDKNAWVSSLKPEQKELLKLEIDTLDSSWLAQLKEELISTSFLNLKRFLQKEIDSNKAIFPPLEEVYSWCVLFTFQELL